MIAQDLTLQEAVHVKDDGDDVVITTSVVSEIRIPRALVLAHGDDAAGVISDAIAERMRLDIEDDLTPCIALKIAGHLEAA